MNRVSRLQTYLGQTYLAAYQFGYCGYTSLSLLSKKSNRLIKLERLLLLTVSFRPFASTPPDMWTIDKQRAGFDSGLILLAIQGLRVPLPSFGYYTFQYLRFQTSPPLFIHLLN